MISSRSLWSLSYRTLWLMSSLLLLADVRSQAQSPAMDPGLIEQDWLLQDVTRHLSGSALPRWTGHRLHQGGRPRGVRRSQGRHLRLSYGRRCESLVAGRSGRPRRDRTRRRLQPLRWQRPGAGVATQRRHLRRRHGVGNRLPAFRRILWRRTGWQTPVAELNGASARWVRVQLPEKGYLHLDEVEVYARGTEANVAIGKPADQSSVSAWSQTARVKYRLPCPQRRNTTSGRQSSGDCCWPCSFRYKASMCPRSSVR